MTNKLPRNHIKALKVSRQRSDRAAKLFEDIEREFTLAGAEAREVYDNLVAELEALEELRTQALAEVKANEHRAKRVRNLLA